MKRTEQIVVVLVAAIVLVAVGSTSGAGEAQKPKTGCINDPDQLNEMNISILDHTQVCESETSKAIDIGVIKAIDEKLILAHTNACADDANGYDTIYACKAMKNYAYALLFTDYTKTDYANGIKGKCYASVEETVTIVNALRQEVCPKGGKRSDKKKAASTEDAAAGEGDVAGPGETDPSAPGPLDVPGDDNGGEGAGGDQPMPHGNFSSSDGDCSLMPHAAASAGSALALFLWLAPIALLRQKKRQK